MAALLAGARLVLRQGLRFLPARTVRPAAVSVRCFPSPARFLATAIQDKDTIEPVELSHHTQSRPESGYFRHFGIRLQKTGRVNRHQLFKAFNSVCQAGIPSSTQAWFILQVCGSSMPGVPPSERTEIAEKVWSQLKKLGFVFSETHYNALLKVYLENDHKFSPTEFLSTMEYANLKPDQDTYEALIEAYCNEGDIQGASKILGFMKSNDLPITEAVFSSLIRGHARSGDLESAKNTLSIMEGAELVPGIIAYDALLCAYAEKGDIEGIKQTIRDCKETLTCKVFLNVIYCLAKTGHTQFVPDIIEHMDTCTVIHQEVINQCLNLLTQGYGDTALEVAKKLISTQYQDPSFESQPGSFFVHHCIVLNLPARILKTYAPILEESKLHCSPLQFGLYCALSADKKDLALDFIRTLKEEGLPVRPHYCWPLLASFNNENNVQGFLKVLKVMKEVDVVLDLDTFHVYVAEFFANFKSPESILQENEFQEDFNAIYLSTLKFGLVTRQIKSVYDLLSLNIPLVMDTSLAHTLSYAIQRRYDAELLAKITKLLYQDGSSLQKPLSETETLGYFLYGLIGSLKDPDVQAKEEHVKQYLHHLKEMDVTVEHRKTQHIIQLLRTRNFPQLIKSIKELASPQKKELTSSQKVVRKSIKELSSQQVVVREVVLELEEELERLKTGDINYEETLRNLVNALFTIEDLEKMLELTSKHGSDFTFGMYMKVLNLCCVKDKAKEALKIKAEMTSREDFTESPTALTYMRLVNVLAQNGLIEDAINVLKEMHERAVAADVVSNGLFQQILYTLAMKGDVDAVNQLHEHILMLDLAKPSVTICSPLVMVHLQRNDLSAALDSMMNCFKKYKCCPMEYALLLKLVEMGESDLLTKAVDFISNALGERFMLNNLLFVFIELGRYEEALKIAETPGLRAIPSKIKWVFERYARQNLVEAMEKSVDITQELYGMDREETYHQLLWLYKKTNNWAKAIPLWQKMKTEKVKVQKKTQTLFIKTFKESGQDVLTWIPEFNEERNIPDISNKGVVDLCKKGDLNGAYNLFLEIEQTHTTLKMATYAKLIKSLLKGGQLEDALHVQDVAKNHFSDYRMENVSCNLLLAEQVRRDCLKDALVTLEKLLGNGNMPGKATVNRLSDAFAMKGDVGSLEKMEEMMTSSSLDLHKMYKRCMNAKLLAHFRNENFEEVTSMIESLCTENPQTSLRYLFHNLIENSMSEALEKASIVAERLSAQFSVYRPVTELFLVLLQLGKVNEAKQLLERCSAIQEQSEILRPHIIMHSFRGQKEYITQLMGTLTDPVYKQLGYSCLMKHYISIKKLSKALSVYESMKAEQIEPDKDSLKRLAVSLRDAGKPVPFPEPQDSVQSSSEEESSTSSLSDEKH
ncbi:leucine-rich PPR motif-containing protein, mitochondrial [Lithobates pipiens]